MSTFAEFVGHCRFVVHLSRVWNNWH